MKTQAVLALLGLAAPAGAFLPVPAACSGHAAGAVAAASEAAARPAARSAGGRVQQHLVMKKEPSARGKAAKAKAKGDADEAGDPRRQALDGVLHQIERCYGRGSILKMGDSTSMDVETSSTGVYCCRRRALLLALPFTELCCGPSVCVLLLMNRPDVDTEPSG